MWTSYFAHLMRLCLLGVMLRVAYELEKPRPADQGASPAHTDAGVLPSLSQVRREWAERSVAGYIRQQEKKWRRWDEVMFKAKYSSGS